MSDLLNSGVVDLQAYVDRIDYKGSLSPSVEVLNDLHQAHATHIPFENLDILFDREIRLDLPALQSKLVTAKRGGYCFEQNLLFSQVLSTIGFSVTQLAARVRLRTTDMQARTHMALMVHAEEMRWLADVGFGGGGLLLPLPLQTGEFCKQAMCRFRLREHKGEWTLESSRGEGWRSLYSFTLEPQFLPDYEMANYYTSTHPQSRFVRNLTAQILTPTERWTLINTQLTRDDGETSKVRTLQGREELLNVLAERFGIHLSDSVKLDPPGL